MVEQVTRMARAAVAIKIDGRRGDGHALDTRSDRHRDHVLLQPLVVADAGIAARGEHIDEAVLRDDLQPDVWVEGEEARHDRGQHEPRGADRHVEPERSRRAAASADDDVQRRLDFAERRRQPLDQSCADLGRRHASGRPVEQAHAQPRLEAAQGFAQRRGAGPAHSSSVAEPTGLGDGEKGGQVSKVGVHRAIFRTTRADHVALSRASATPI